MASGLEVVVDEAFSTVEKGEGERQAGQANEDGNGEGPGAISVSETEEAELAALFDDEVDGLPAEKLEEYIAAAGGDVHEDAGGEKEVAEGGGEDVEEVAVIDDNEGEDAAEAEGENNEREREHRCKSEPGDKRDAEEEHGDQQGDRAHGEVAQGLERGDDKEGHFGDAGLEDVAPVGNEGAGGGAEGFGKGEEEQNAPAGVDGAGKGGAGRTGKDAEVLEAGVDDQRDARHDEDPEDAEGRAGEAVEIEAAEKSSDEAGVRVQFAQPAALGLGEGEGGVAEVGGGGKGGHGDRESLNRACRMLNSGKKGNDRNGGTKAEAREGKLSRRERRPRGFSGGPEGDGVFWVRRNGVLWACKTREMF